MIRANKFRYKLVGHAPLQLHVEAMKKPLIHMREKIAFAHMDGSILSTVCAKLGMRAVSRTEKRAKFQNPQAAGIARVFCAHVSMFAANFNSD